MSRDFNPGEVVHDPLLKTLAKRFENLPDFPDSDNDRGREKVFGESSPKHLYKFPGMPIWAVKHFIGGKNRCLAFVNKDRLDDGLRFADAITFRFWKYRIRGAEHMNESQFNFSSDAARQDLEDWAEAAPEIVKLIDDIEEHFLNMDIFAEKKSNDPHGKTARRTLRGEMKSMETALQTDAADRHQELLDCIAALVERVGELEKAIEVVRQWVTSNTHWVTLPGTVNPDWVPPQHPGWPVSPSPTSTDDPLPQPTVVCTITNPNAHDDIFIPPADGRSEGHSQ